MDAVNAAKNKVQRILANTFGSVEVDKDGDFVFRKNSANTFVNVDEGFGENGVIITITCPLVFDVPVTAELCRWVAVEGQKFRIGRVALEVDDNGLGWLFFRYSMIGNDLDESELLGGLGAVLGTSDRLDNDLKDRFGGELYGDE